MGLHRREIGNDRSNVGSGCPNKKEREYLIAINNTLKIEPQFSTNFGIIEIETIL